MNKTLLLFLCILLSSPSYAYLDPGSGSLLTYFVLGIFATVIFSIKSFFIKIKHFLFNRKSNISFDLSKSRELVFHSEGGQYWNLFSPIINALCNKQIKTTYLTSKKDDPAFEFKSNYFECIYIGDSLESVFTLNRIKSNVLITTTPQLDVMHFKRSKQVDYYIHLIHAPTSIASYRLFAFDYFDCIMCSGPHQINSLRSLESKRNTKSKKLLETGLVYLDVLVESAKPKKNFTADNILNNSEITVLIAPTWGQNSLLNLFGIYFINKLQQDGFHIIIRPHPQSYISEKSIIESLSQFKECSNVSIDKNSSALESMNQADILISDFSGIIFDFAFVYKKPILVCKSKISLDGYEYLDLEKEIPWELESMERIAIEINETDLAHIDSIIHKKINEKSINEVEKLRDESVFNFGNAGDVAANQVVAILNQIKNQNNQ